MVVQATQLVYKCDGCMSFYFGYSILLDFKRRVTLSRLFHETPLYHHFFCRLSNRDTILVNGKKKKTLATSEKISLTHVIAAKKAQRRSSDDERKTAFVCEWRRIHCTSQFSISSMQGV